jgi:hypothetical protein
MRTDESFLSRDMEDRRTDIREDADAARLDAFDDEQLELALKSVCWTPRDVHHFLRGCPSR